MKILVLNSGSSSQKTALYDAVPEKSPDPVPPLWEGRLEWDGRQEKIELRNCQGSEITWQSEQKGGQDSIKKMLSGLWSGPTAVLRDLREIVAVGHRIVHGGPDLAEPTIITMEVKRAIGEVSAIAPLHNQAGLQGIELVEEMLPGVPQIAMFDTGFHRTIPRPAIVYPGPYEWAERGIRRYGFHGINHEYCAQRVARLLGRDISTLKTVTCHLGNGCSLAAVDGGHSVDTTMGFTPLEGLMMGTRAGSVDPGILTFLMRDGTDAAALDEVLNRRSGLLGISGVSSDMREVLVAAGQGNERAQLAFDMFVHRLQTGIAAMSASLGGLDALVFTAGIGENSAAVRRAACAKLSFLGIQIHDAKNSAVSPDQDISSADTKVRVLVIRAQEEWAIAQECARLEQLQGRGAQFLS
jgi:acetate kinase